MVAHAWQVFILVVTALSLLAGCASSPYVGTGAVVGGSVGSLMGAAIGNRNPWAGALVGGLVGTGVGAAGGYMLQQRQYSQPQQGYYPAQPGYGAPAPYGYRGPAPGPAYGYNNQAPATPNDPRYSANGAAPAPAPPPSAHSWNTPAPVTPPESGYSNNSAPPAYARTPIKPAPYTYQQPVE
jgi:hypothetical protein